MRQITESTRSFHWERLGPKTHQSQASHPQVRPADPQSCAGLQTWGPSLIPDHRAPPVTSAEESRQEGIQNLILKHSLFREKEGVEKMKEYFHPHPFVLLFISCPNLNKMTHYDIKQM